MCQCNSTVVYVACDTAADIQYSRHSKTLNTVQQLISLTLVNDFLPQSFNESRVVVVGAVDDGQLALREFKRVGKLTVQLQRTTEHSISQ